MPASSEKKVSWIKMWGLINSLNLPEAVKIIDDIHYNGYLKVYCFAFKHDIDNVTLCTSCYHNFNVTHT